jgi:hypothetical protein
MGMAIASAVYSRNYLSGHVAQKAAIWTQKRKIIVAHTGTGTSPLKGTNIAGVVYSMNWVHPDHRGVVVDKILVL